jgi:hypothetical protein
VIQPQSLYSVVSYATGKIHRPHRVRPPPAVPVRFDDERLAVDASLWSIGKSRLRRFFGHQLFAGGKSVVFAACRVA